MPYMIRVCSDNNASVRWSAAGSEARPWSRYKIAYQPVFNRPSSSPIRFKSDFLCPCFRRRVQDGYLSALEVENVTSCPGGIARPTCVPPSSVPPLCCPALHSLARPRPWYVRVLDTAGSQTCCAGSIRRWSTVQKPGTKSGLPSPH